MRIIIIVEDKRYPQDATLINSPNQEEGGDEKIVFTFAGFLGGWFDVGCPG
jgi:hypothetical protein